MTDDRHPEERGIQGNADDPTADRLAAYPEAGELGSAQGALERDGSGPRPPQPASLDSEIIATGGSGGGLGGPAATDAPGGGPGMPGPADDDTRGTDPDAPGQQAPSTADDGSLVDRLDR